VARKETVGSASSLSSKKQQAKDGSFPFANIAVGTIKKRHSEHLKLQDHWEKTPPDDSECDEGKSSGKQRLSVLIEDAVEELLESEKKAAEAKEKEEEEKRQTEWAHKGQVDEIKAKALGNLESHLAAVSDKAPGATSNSQAGKSNKSGGTMKTNGGTGALETLDDSIAEFAKKLDEMKKRKAEVAMEHEKRKKLEAENKKMELENKKKELELQKQQFELMMKHSMNKQE